MLIHVKILRKPRALVVVHLEENVNRLNSCQSKWSWLPGIGPFSCSIWGLGYQRDLGGFGVHNLKNFGPLWVCGVRPRRTLSNKLQYRELLPLGSHRSATSRVPLFCFLDQFIQVLGHSGCLVCSQCTLKQTRVLGIAAAGNPSHRPQLRQSTTSPSPLFSGVLDDIEWVGDPLNFISNFRFLLFCFIDQFVQVLFFSGEFLAGIFLPTMGFIGQLTWTSMATSTPEIDTGAS